MKIIMTKILHLSDTHNLHRQLGNLPTADIIVHSGDISYAGTGTEVADFIEWFGALDYEFKIFIAGNHDFCLEGKNLDTIQRFLPENCFYLYNSGIKIGDVKFWGVPFFFSDDVSGKYVNRIAQIPTDIDVLISHRPPLGILDNSKDTVFGCPELLRKVLEVRPRYHLFGHIHDAYGVQQSRFTTFSNASIVGEGYNLENAPNIFHLRT